MTGRCLPGPAVLCWPGWLLNLLVLALLLLSAARANQQCQCSLLHREPCSGDTPTDGDQQACGPCLPEFGGPPPEDRSSACHWLPSPQSGDGPALFWSHSAGAADAVDGIFRWTHAPGAPRPTLLGEAGHVHFRQPSPQLSASGGSQTVSAELLWIEGALGRIISGSDLGFNRTARETPAELTGGGIHAVQDLQAGQYWVLDASAPKLYLLGPRGEPHPSLEVLETVELRGGRGRWLDYHTGIGRLFWISCGVGSGEGEGDICRLYQCLPAQGCAATVRAWESALRSSCASVLAAVWEESLGALLVACGSQKLLAVSSDFAEDRIVVAQLDFAPAAMASDPRRQRLYMLSGADAAEPEAVPRLLMAHVAQFEGTGAAFEEILRFEPPEGASAAPQSGLLLMPRCQADPDRCSGASDDYCRTELNRQACDSCSASAWGPDTCGPCLPSFVSQTAGLALQPESPQEACCPGLSRAVCGPLNRHHCASDPGVCGPCIGPEYTTAGGDSAAREDGMMPCLRMSDSDGPYVFALFAHDGLYRTAAVQDRDRLLAHSQLLDFARLSSSGRLVVLEAPVGSERLARLGLMENELDPNPVWFSLPAEAAHSQGLHWMPLTQRLFLVDPTPATGGIFEVDLGATGGPATHRVVPADLLGLGSGPAIPESGGATQFGLTSDPETGRLYWAADGPGLVLSCVPGLVCCSATLRRLSFAARLDTEHPERRLMPPRRLYLDWTAAQLYWLQGDALLRVDLGCSESGSGSANATWLTAVGELQDARDFGFDMSRRQVWLADGPHIRVLELDEPRTAGLVTMTGPAEGAPILALEVDARCPADCEIPAVDAETCRSRLLRGPCSSECSLAGSCGLCLPGHVVDDAAGDAGADGGSCCAGASAGLCTELGRIPCSGIPGECGPCLETLRAGSRASALEPCVPAEEALPNRLLLALTARTPDGWIPLVQRVHEHTGLPVAAGGRSRAIELLRGVAVTGVAMAPSDEAAGQLWLLEGAQARVHVVARDPAADPSTVVLQLSPASPDVVVSAVAVDPWASVVYWAETNVTAGSRQILAANFSLQPPAGLQTPPEVVLGQAQLLGDAGALVRVGDRLVWADQGQGLAACRIGLGTADGCASSLVRRQIPGILTLAADLVDENIYFSGTQAPTTVWRVPAARLDSAEAYPAASLDAGVASSDGPEAATGILQISIDGRRRRGYFVASAGTAETTVWSWPLGGPVAKRQPRPSYSFPAGSASVTGLGVEPLCEEMPDSTVCDLPPGFCDPRGREPCDGCGPVHTCGVCASPGHIGSESGEQGPGNDTCCPGRSQAECAGLNREACGRLPGTCGACLSGYTSDKFDSGDELCQPRAPDSLAVVFGATATGSAAQLTELRAAEIRTRSNTTSPSRSLLQIQDGLADLHILPVFRADASQLQRSLQLVVVQAGSVAIRRLAGGQADPRLLWSLDADGSRLLSPITRIIWGPDGLPLEDGGELLVIDSAGASVRSARIVPGSEELHVGTLLAQQQQAPAVVSAARYGDYLLFSRHLEAGIWMCSLGDRRGCAMFGAGQPAEATMFFPAGGQRVTGMALDVVGRRLFWRTLTRVYQSVFRPGDQFALTGSDTPDTRLLFEMGTSPPDSGSLAPALRGQLSWDPDGQRLLVLEPSFGRLWVLKVGSAADGMGSQAVPESHELPDAWLLAVEEPCAPDPTGCGPLTPDCGGLNRTACSSCTPNETCGRCRPGFVSWPSEDFGFPGNDPCCPGLPEFVCAPLNRESCSPIPNTCGPCLPGWFHESSPAAGVTPCQEAVAPSPAPTVTTPAPSTPAPTLPSTPGPTDAPPTEGPVPTPPTSAPSPAPSPGPTVSPAPTSAPMPTPTPTPIPTPSPTSTPAPTEDGGGIGDQPTGSDSDGFPVIPVVAGVVGGLLLCLLYLVLWACCCRTPSSPPPIPKKIHDGAPSEELEFATVAEDAAGGTSTTAPAEDPQPLPAGWEEHRSPEGVPYFYSTETGTCQWQRPTLPATADHDRLRSGSDPVPATVPAEPEPEGAPATADPVLAAEAIPDSVQLAAKYGLPLDPAGTWEIHESAPEGRPFFHNRLTGVSVYQIPY